MENIVGQPSRFVLCTRYTMLTDELSKLTRDTTRVVVVSCLTNIVATLASAPDVRSALSKAMSSLGAVLKDLVRTNVGIRVFVAPCTARTTPDFGTHADYALVSQEKCF